MGNLRPAVRDQDRSHQRSEKLHVGDVEICTGDGFDHQSGRDAIDAQATDRFRELGGNQSEPTHALHERAIQLPLALSHGITRRQPVGGKAAGGVAHRLLLGAQIKFHRACASLGRAGGEIKATSNRTRMFDAPFGFQQSPAILPRLYLGRRPTRRANACSSRSTSALLVPKMTPVAPAASSLARRARRASGEPVNVICPAALVSISASWPLEMSQLWPRLTARWRIGSGTCMTLSSQAWPPGNCFTASGSCAKVL